MEGKEVFKNDDVVFHQIDEHTWVGSGHMMASTPFCSTLRVHNEYSLRMTLPPFASGRWKTGEEPPFSKGGAVLADGLLLATDGNRKLYLIEPDPSGFKPLATAELLEPGNNWAPIALVDGKLLIRDQKQLKVVQVGR